MIVKNSASSNGYEEKKTENAKVRIFSLLQTPNLAMKKHF